MTFDNNDGKKEQHGFNDQTGEKAALWIDDETGKIVDGISTESPSRQGPGRVCFQLAEIELRPTTHRRITKFLRPMIEEPPRPVDLVGSVPDRPTITLDALPEPHVRLLLGKRGGP